MRLIVEADDLPGTFYANMQAEADEYTDGELSLGTQSTSTEAGVTILAIEIEDGRYGWLKGTVSAEQARALRQAAAVLAETDQSSQAQEVAAYLTGTAQHIEIQAGLDPAAQEADHG